MVNRLAEYQRYKEITSEFKTLEALRQEVYTKLPEDYNSYKDDVIIEESNYTVDDLVEAFEKNNFVWGGKWSHFDILHFEYRPEIILKAKYFSDNKNSSNWFDGAPLDDENTQNYIKLIDENL